MIQIGGLFPIFDIMPMAALEETKVTIKEGAPKLQENIL